MEKLCEFYPTPEDDTCVCFGGSDISGAKPCTDEESKECPYGPYKTGWIEARDAWRRGDLTF